MPHLQLLSANRQTVQEVGCCDRRLSILELGESHLGIAVDKGLLVDPPHALHGAGIEDVLRPTIDREFALKLASFFRRSRDLFLPRRAATHARLCQ